jgi:SAM-dependent methyltransferase
LNFEKDKKILDLGSGSGRLYPVLAEFDLDYTGIDLSEELVKNARKDFPKGNFLIGDATNLPFSDNTFGYVVSVAVLYHIPSKEMRKIVMSEIYRITKPGGKIYISVWNFWNKWSDLKLIILESVKIFFGKSVFDYGDFYRPWKTPDGKVVTDRFCHAWTSRGLQKYLIEAGFTKTESVLESRERNNLNIIASKSSK